MRYSNRNTHYLWLAGIAIIALSLFIGTTVGGIAGYVVSVRV